MNMEKLFEDGNVLALHITGVLPAYINTLRRYMASRVPTMAIDSVEFKSNNSILYDEMVAHRLGLLPLTTDLETYRLPKEEWIEPTGDPRVEVQLSLKVPKVKSETVVRAKDLSTKDKKIVPVYPDMPIVKLMEGQDIELVATARLGIGEGHAKWSPGHVWYRHFPHIAIKKQPKDPKALVERFPGVFEVKGGKLALTKDAAYRMPDMDIADDGIEVSFADDDYILTVESWGQLTPKEIVNQAFSAYDDQLDEFAKLVKEIK